MTVSRTLDAPFVRDDAGTLRGALIVRASSAIAREAPVQGESNAIAERARDQQDVLIARLSAHGVATAVLEAQADAPQGWAVGDCAVVFPQGAFLMRPSALGRGSELPAVEAALAAAGVPIIGRIAAPGLLDGGDVLLGPQTLFLGVPLGRQSEIGIPVAVRGNAAGRAQLAAYARSAGYEVVEVPLAAEVRRLRSVASLVASETVLVAPGLADAEAFGGLKRLEARRGEDYGAGVLTLGERRVLANLRFRETVPMLRKSKIGVDAIDLWEFGKIGATPSSLVLALKRG
jgi:dimethylargininase